MNRRQHLPPPAATGAQQNRVQHCHTIPKWEFGLTALMHNLARRGLLGDG